MQYAIKTQKAAELRRKMRFVPSETLATVVDKVNLVLTESDTGLTS